MRDYSEIPKRVADIIKASFVPAANGDAATTERDLGAAQSRFGIGVTIAGFAALLAAVLPLPVTVGDRLWVVGFAVATLAVGAWQIDRGNRRVKRALDAGRNKRG